MRRAVPDGWAATPETVRVFEEEPERWMRIVRRQARRLREDPCFEWADMESEGAMVVLYAIQEYLATAREPDTGSPEALVAVMVRRYLRDRCAKVRNERRKTCGSDLIEFLIPVPERRGAWGWEEFIAWRNRVRRFWNALAPRDRGVLYLRLHPPPELIILDRNLCAFHRKRISRQAVAFYTGLSLGQVRRSLWNCQKVAACIFGRRNRDLRERELLGYEIRVRDAAEAQAEPASC